MNFRARPISGATNVTSSCSTGGGDGRTSHPRQIENFLGHEAIAGGELVKRGPEQARKYGVQVQTARFTRLGKDEFFSITTGTGTTYRARYVIASTGARDNLPDLENLARFFGTSFFTCVDCDGSRTTGKRLAVMGNSIPTVHLASAMKEMYTDDVTLVLFQFRLPGVYQDELDAAKVVVVTGRPVCILGGERMEGLEFRDGTRLPCELIRSNFGHKLNDDYLEGLSLKKDG